MPSIDDLQAFITRASAVGVLERGAKPVTFLRGHHEVDALTDRVMNSGTTFRRGQAAAFDRYLDDMLHEPQVVVERQQNKEPIGHA